MADKVTVLAVIGALFSVYVVAELLSLVFTGSFFGEAVASESGALYQAIADKISGMSVTVFLFIVGVAVVVLSVIFSLVFMQSLGLHKGGRR